jgi:predicted peptidase
VKVPILAGLLSLAVLSSPVLFAEGPERNDGARLLRVSYVSDLDSMERDFFLYLPKGYEGDPGKKWPTILFLHGDGERGDGKADLDFLFTNGPLYEAWIQKRDLPFVIVAPQLHMFGRDRPGGPPYLVNRTRNTIPRRLETGTPQRTPDAAQQGVMNGAVPAPYMPSMSLLAADGWNRVEKDLIAILNSVMSRYRVDAARIYLTGLSYGGFGAWFMASRHADLFAALCPIVGWGHPDLMEPIARAKIPVWAFSGGMDPVVETRYFFAGLNRLKELGDPEVRFTTQQDMGHEVWTRVYAGNDIYDWFLGKSKK